MAHHLKLQFAAATDPGMVRAENEDAIVCLPEQGIAILADGMGGYNAGEVASKIAIDVCREILVEAMRVFSLLTPSDRGITLEAHMRDAVELANATIFRAAQNDPACAGMGTTLVATLLHHDRLLVAHVGDSRLYRFRRRVLEPLTKDHSQVQEQLDAGLISAETARHASNRNLVTRALGIAPQVDIDFNQFVTKANDIYLLCSDGLSDMVADNEIADILYGAPTLERAATGLIAHANNLGGRDNISLVLFRLLEVEQEFPSVLKRMRNWVR